MKAYIRNNLLFCIVTVVLSMFIASCISITALGQSSLNDEETEKNFHLKEQEMLERVRAYLNDNGYQNSGVTLTRMVDGNGYRTYTLTIHHDRIDFMDEEGRSELKSKLAEFNFPADGCSFNQEFLILSHT